MKLKHCFLLTVILLLFPENSFSQAVVVADSDKRLFSKYAVQIAPYQAEPIETILEQTALFFLGTPYVASTLDKNDEEQLVVNLQELDCVTFVENVMALSLVASHNNLSRETFTDSLTDSFIEKLTEIRYRNSQLTDYASRIHYTSDWMHENERKGLLRNISKDLSEVKETKQINFMSTHQSAYKQLANDDAMLAKIADREDIMNSRGGFYYLPKVQIATQAKDIPHMALIGFVTTIDGLDTTHVGLAYRQKDGELGFIHASSQLKKVVIDSKTLSDYCLSQKSCKGIIVAEIIN